MYNSNGARRVFYENLCKNMFMIGHAGQRCLNANHRLTFPLRNHGSLWCTKPTLPHLELAT